VQVAFSGQSDADVGLKDHARDPLQDRAACVRARDRRVGVRATRDAGLAGMMLSWIPVGALIVLFSLYCRHARATGIFHVSLEQGI